MTEHAELNKSGDAAANAALGRELLHVTIEKHHELDDGVLEVDIRRSEETLGLTTTPKRLIEAGLVIDKKFLDTAIITGQPAKPERIFGAKEWAGYLAARLFARQYGNQPLTIDFILALHQRFLDIMEPGKISTILDRSRGRGGQYIEGYRGLDIVGRLAPITCTNEQIKAINDNPLLGFDIDKESAISNTGFIVYPDMPMQERRERLDEMCVEYNAAQQASDADPHRAAATMQRRFVSLHSLIGGEAGRVSRALMNWSLENADESPSIVDDLDGDLFLPEEEWVNSVRFGSSRYGEYQRRAEAGETNPVVLFGLEQEKMRYDELLGTSGIYSPSLAGSGWHDHCQCEKFLTELRTSM